jgi:hypothetical protein
MWQKLSEFLWYNQSKFDKFMETINKASIASQTVAEQEKTLKLKEFIKKEGRMRMV